MDILEFIKQMQEMYGEDVITTADKLEKPPKTVVREMFQNAFKDNKADGGRAGYNNGQLVTPSADGSRPGYQGKENKYIPPKIKKQFENVTEEVKKLVNKANVGEKHVKILDITKEIEKKFKIKVSGGRLDIRSYPSLLNLDSRADKIDKVLKNMLIDDKPLKNSWYDAIQNRTGISQDTIGDYLKKSQTYNVIKNEGANYLKYISSKKLGVNLKNMSFSDQLKYASELKKGMPTYTDMEGNKRYSGKPRNKVMEFALRNWNQNKGEGPIKFFNKNGKLISWEFGKKLSYTNVSFSYAGKNHKFNKMDMNYLKTNFPEVYEKQTALNRLAIKEVDNPFKKGSKIAVKDLIKKIQVDGYRWPSSTSTLDIMHGKKGVAGEPFTNLTYASRDLNQLESGINSSLRAGNITKTQANNAIKVIRKDIQGKTGDVLDTAIINRQLSLAKDIKAGKIKSYKDFSMSLADLGCPKSVQKASGGRIKYSTGSTCAIKGKKRLEQIILRGGANKTEQDLAKKILQAGRGLRGMFSLSGMFGPAALAFTAATEAGFVGYDMLSKGKTFREAVGDSVFNYALGDRTKIDTRKERDKRLRDIGGGPPSQAFRAMSEKEMGKIAAYESALSDIDELENIFNKDAIAKQKLQQAKKFSPAVVDKRQKEADAVRADIRDLAKTGTEQRLMNVDYEAGAKALAEAQRRSELDQLQSVNTSLLSPIGQVNIADRKKELMLQNPDILNYMGPYPTTLGFASGGLANLTDTIPPESGPMSQGLRSLYNNDMDY